MSRILMVGNFAHISLGRTCYGVDRKLYSGFIRAGHHVWDFSDRDVSRASNIFLNRKLGVGKTNQKLLQTVKNFMPDLLLLGHANIIRNDTLREIKSLYPHIRIAVFNVDSLAFDGHMDNVKWLTQRADVVDAMFITTGAPLLRQFKRPQNIVCYFPNPIDPAIENGKVFEKNDQPNDLIFCVGGVSAGDQRAVAAEYIRDKAPDIKTAFYGMFGVPSVWGADYPKILQQAKMGLNFSRPNNVYLYSSDRMAHLLGNGLLTLTAAECGFQKFFNTDEIVFYKDLDDMIEKARFYKKNDTARQSVARKGSEKAHLLFPNHIVAQYIFEMSLGLPLSQDYGWRDESIL